MAYTAKSQVITDLTSDPLVKQNTLKAKGKLRSAYGYVAAADLKVSTVGQTAAYCRVPANARIVSIKAKNASMGNGDFSIGLFSPTLGIAVDATCLAAHWNLTANDSAEVYKAGTADVMGEDVATQFATAIGTAGATADVEFDVVATVVTVSTGSAVATGLEVQYVLPE